MRAFGSAASRVERALARLHGYSELREMQIVDGASLHRVNSDDTGFYLDRSAHTSCRRSRNFSPIVARPDPLSAISGSDNQRLP